MTNQIIDRRTIGIPGATGDVTPELESARDAAVEAAERAAGSSADAARAKTEADRAERAADSVDMGAINTRLDGMDSNLGAKADLVNGRVPATQINAGSSAISGTIPLRGASGRLPGIGVPTGSSDATTKQYVDTEIERAKPVVLTPTSTIKHVERAAFNYEVIRVSGAPDALRKISPKATRSDGTIDTVDCLTPVQMAEESGFSALTSANGYFGFTSGGRAQRRSNGLNIQAGRALQNFGVVSTVQGTDLESLLMMRDGSLRAARKTDNKTAQQYVNDGAVDSYGFGPILVENGQMTNWWSDSRFSGFVGSKSARTILGQAENGDYLIILVEGKTNSYGIDGRQISELARDEGCVVAINLDGGGSTQGVWRGDAVHPSTDDAGSRALLTFIAINAVPVNEYDSGVIPIPSPSNVSASSQLPAVSLRQRGAQVDLRFAASPASGTWPSDSWVAVTSEPIPERYRAETAAFGRGMVYGTTGLPVGISTAGSGIVSARARVGGQSFNTLEGVMTYRARHA